jgi:hypothetical protein
MGAIWSGQTGRAVQRSPQGQIYFAGSCSIDELLLIDREVDCVTPLCTQLTYEGLLEETMGIKNGTVTLEKEGGAPVLSMLGQGRKTPWSFVAWVPGNTSCTCSHVQVPNVSQTWQRKAESQYLWTILNLISDRASEPLLLETPSKPDSQHRGVCRGGEAADHG